MISGLPKSHLGTFVSHLLQMFPKIIPNPPPNGPNEVQNRLKSKQNSSFEQNMQNKYFFLPKRSPTPKTLRAQYPQKSKKKCSQKLTLFFEDPLHRFYWFLRSFFTFFFIKNRTFHTLSTKRPNMRFDCAMASGLRVGPLEIYPKMLKNRLQKCPRKEALKQSEKS